MTVGEYLNQPFPYPGSKWKMNGLFLSLFVTGFLLIFQPIGSPLPHKQFIIAGYGLVCFIVGSILHLIFLNAFPKIFEEDTWTIKRHLLWFAFQLVFVGLANHYYSLCFLPFHPTGISGILLFQVRAFGLGIFPITMHVFLTHIRLLTKNLKEASEINQVIATNPNKINLDERICLTAENEKDAIEINISDLDIIESVGNYIQVYYSQNGVFKNTILRSSLKRTENYLIHYKDIVKCHRAFIVKLHNLTYVKGNSQGYRLCFGRHDKEIPVSRNYAKIIKEQLESIHAI